MNEIITLCGYFTLVFACSVGAGWLLTTMRRSTKLVREPAPDSAVRLRGPEAMYRAYFVGGDRSVWRVTAPLSRDRFVPLRSGEKLVLEAPSSQGALLYKTVVVGRDPETHEILLKKADPVLPVERREDPRLEGCRGREVLLEQGPATLLDLSSCGARLFTQEQVARGERVRLDLEWLDEPIFGWVLESQTLVHEGLTGREVRMRFEEAISLSGS
jgi:hypothetical protein